MELQEFINDMCEELENSSSNKQRKRYLKSHLEELLEYQKHHLETQYSLQFFQCR